MEAILSIMVFVGCHPVVYADDATQQQILDEVRGMRYEQQYNRTLDSWTDSIRRNNRQIQRNWNNDSDYDDDWNNDCDRNTDDWYPDPDGGLVIPGGHFE